MKTERTNRITRRLAGVAALLGALGVPEVAAACSVCFSATEAARGAFIWTTVFLSLLPLGLLLGGGWWLYRRFSRAEADDALAEAAELQPSSPTLP